MANELSLVSNNNPRHTATTGQVLTYQSIKTMLLAAVIFAMLVLSSTGHKLPRDMTISASQLKTDPDILLKYTQIFSEGQYERNSRGIPDMKKDPCNRRM